MIKNYIKVAWRNLVRNKLYSVISIGGLSLGLMISMLITLFVSHEYSFDRFHVNGDHIFKMHSTTTIGENKFNMLNFSAVSGELVKKNDQTVTDYIRIQHQYSPVVIQNTEHPETRFSEKKVLYADANFFSFFTFPLLEGNKTKVLNRPFAVVISKEAARKYFGNRNPIGKTLNLVNGQKYPLQVSGVMKDSPSNSDFQADFIVSMETMKQMPETEPAFRSQVFQGGSFSTFFKLENVADTSHVMRTMQILDMGTSKDQKDDYQLTALSDLHIKMNSEDSGSTKYLKVLLIIAVLILLLALINYMSLATARATLRAKEVGVRKVTGATKTALTSQFYIESTVFTLLSFAIAYLLCAFFQQQFYNLVNIKIDESFLYGKSFLTTLLVVLCITVFFAGSYPSFVLSAFKPIETLNGKLSVKNGGALVRKILTTLQFTISVSLIICGIVIQQQLNFLRNTETGIDRENVLMIPVSETFGNHLQVFRKDIRNLSVIKHIATAHYPLFKGYDVFFTKDQKNRDVTVPVLSVDKGFIPTLDIKWKFKPEAGNNFSNPDQIIINESAIRNLSLTGNPVNKMIDFGNKKYRIAGVVKDFNFNSLNSKIDALAMFIVPDTTSKWGIGGNAGACVFIKIQSKTNLPSLISRIKGFYEKADSVTPFQYEFLDDAYNELYKAEERLAALFNIFIGLTILIAGMGLFGLATFSTQQRIKEIGIRKVLGASVSQISAMLSMDFLKLVLLSILIASPIAWLIMNKWLQDFAYKITISWWIFLLAGMGSIVISIVTVSFQAVKAALANPVNSLRAE
ncbi:FtsX-like permease family protein [Pedobacter sp. HMF7647]|uniref:FtsX-like permease family protein n=1 Tax=Hufsiella arboris TaxID=2695275 RepID=A0A7K1YA59_9SPHI|nr:ABC transporter permease [Hufsiella arboris]MXV51467.1 FtsX-like permease family protein [Hufsiella arboris]